MTKAQFKKLKVGDYVKVITALFGYTQQDGKLSTMAGLGPWVGKIKAIGDGMADVSFQTSETTWASGLKFYPQIVSKSKPKINGFNKATEKNK